MASLYNTSGLTTEWDISNTSLAKPGYHQLIVTNNSNCRDTVNINIVHDVKKWLGTVSSEWGDPQNWSDSFLPNEKTHVYVSGDAINPCFTSVAL